MPELAVQDPGPENCTFRAPVLFETPGRIRANPRSELAPLFMKKCLWPFRRLLALESLRCMRSPKSRDGQDAECKATSGSAHRRYFRPQSPYTKDLHFFGQAAGKKRGGKLPRTFQTEIFLRSLDLCKNLLGSRVSFRV